MNLARAALHNYQFSIIGLLLLVALGAISLATMPRSEDPQFDYPYSMVSVVYPGTDASDMEKMVLDPLEEAINELEDIKVIKSEVEDGLAVVRIEFLIETDPDDKYDDVVGAVARIRSELPSDIFSLNIEKVSPSDVNIMQYALTSSTEPYSELRYFADKLDKKIQQVTGVKRVDVVGVPEQQLQVNADIVKMKELGVSITQLSDAIKSASANIPAGHVNAATRRFTVKTSGDFESVEQLKRTVVAHSSSYVLYVEDVAEVRIADGVPSYLGVYNKQPALFISVVQRKGSNIFDVIETVKKETDLFAERLPNTIELSLVHDQSISVEERINGFFSNLLQGLVLVGIFTFVVLGFRASIVIVTAIPMSVFIGMGWVDIAGYGLQQMSIVGLVIALGLLVDNAIVVTDNVGRYIRRGENPFQAAEKGASQVAMAVASGTFTTILAFFPILLLNTGSGVFIRSMPVTVILTLFASLLVAIAFSPLMAAWLLKTKSTKKTRGLAFIDEKLGTRYRKALAYSLHNPKKILLAAMLVFFGSISLFPFIGVSLFPKAEKAALLVNIELPEGTAFEQTYQMANKVEQVLSNHKLVDNVAVNVGKGNPRIYYNEFPRRQVANFGQLYVLLNDHKAENVTPLVQQLRKEFSKWPGVNITVKEFMQGPPAEAPIEIRIIGDELDKLRDVAIDVERMLEDIEGTVSIDNPISKNKIDLQVTINREKAALLGVPIHHIDQAIRASLVGERAGIYRDQRGEEFAIVVKGQSKQEPSLTDLQQLVVTNRQGDILPITQVADIEMITAIPRFRHHNLERMAAVTSDVEAGYQIEALTNQAIEKLDQYDFPEGVSYLIGGEQENRKKSFSGMSQAFMVALMGIFAVLVLQFKSFSQPLIIFAAIPFAISGAFLGLFLAGYTFSFTAFIGLTSLIGIVVNNSIILVDMANQLLASGKDKMEAILSASTSRLSPILLTTMTTIGGLLPLTLEGSTMWSPMGWAIISGLLVSTLLTLFVVPVLYQWLTVRKQVT
ncbi:efflux RND transporter permease subunit [Flocculibacter collagenilyticus]|uniref:efflux RND transporter permease subunit n=1 Tax=Flocculibacter collagenilyticus TaxID=2744479 RepID=UPI0018F44520|nr:efflux RND transporter permease subunit [Flocculibacter collagenilyticus]